MSVTYRRLTADEFLCAPNLERLIDAYSDEASIPGMPAYRIHVPTYEMLEDAGALAVFSADYQGEMIGFITILSNLMPHYSAKLSTIESFFVLHEHRRRGAGLGLLRVAERYAAELGSHGLFVSAPSNGQLAKVLPKFGYEQTNRTFFRKFEHE